MSTQKEEKLHLSKNNTRTSKKKLLELHKNPGKNKNPLSSESNIIGVNKLKRPHDKDDSGQPVNKNRPLESDKVDDKTWFPTAVEASAISAHTSFLEPNNEFVSSTIPSTPKRQGIFEREFQSPSLAERVADGVQALDNAGCVTPGSGLRKSNAALNTCAQRLFSHESHKKKESLFEHIKSVITYDLSSISEHQDADPFTNVHRWHFKANKDYGKVTSCSKIWPKTGSKASLVSGITNYDKISSKFNELATDFGDALIAKTLFDILNGQECNIFNHLSKTKCKSNTKFMTKICYLLFACETSRFEAAAITNAMFLDLVISGKHIMSDIGGLALSSKRVMGAVKKLNSVFQTEYDLSKKKTPHINSAKVRKVMEKNHEILSNWLELKIPNFKWGEISIDQIGKVIEDSMKKWFHDVEVKPFRFEDAKLEEYMHEDEDDEIPLLWQDEDSMDGSEFAGFSDSTKDLMESLGVSYLLED